MPLSAPADQEPPTEGSGSERRGKGFSSQYEQFKRVYKDVVLHPSDAFYTQNQFEAPEGGDSDLSDWVVVKATETEAPERGIVHKEGFLPCFFEEVKSKRRIKFAKHWIALDRDALRCYQSKDTGYQLRFKKIGLQGASVANGHSFTGQKLSFRVTTEGEPLPFYFLAPSMASYNAWVNAIEKSIAGHPKERASEEDGWSNRLISPAPPSLLISRRLSPPQLHGLPLASVDESNPFTPYEEEQGEEELLSDLEMQWIDESLEKHLSKHPECANTIISDHVQMILK